MPSQSFRFTAPGPLRPEAAAFSLAELLTVIAIIVLFMVLALPALTNVSRGRALAKTGADLAGLLEQARAYAMAHSTHVWVGLQEEPDDRLAVATVASRDGGANPATPELHSADSGISQLGPLRRFERIKLVGESLPHRTPDDGITTFAEITTPVLAFTAGPAGNPVTFDTCVVEFNPRGEARVLPTQISRVVEIGLQTAVDGTVIEPENYLAIQLRGLSGSISVLQP